MYWWIQSWRIPIQRNTRQKKNHTERIISYLFSDQTITKCYGQKFTAIGYIKDQDGSILTVSMSDWKLSNEN